VSYLVLARKWRPKNFEQVVGQDHIVRTLAHSLDNERLHHAYLFTGTRGVGKTTLARILAKSLNCEQGITSTPCKQCDACRQIDEGRFIDLIEVDAASNTKVEDTRALLDNVPYSATAGRFKVYLIDEIHMLSTSSFNALLKTLEEPPAHVKFLMATTDPQKLPVTVLSRCIQFNLRALDSNEIALQLNRILDAEQIKYEPEAVAAIARQSKGSMRDGLSILDQAISYTDSNLQEPVVREMLGMISQDFLVSLIQAIADQQAEQIPQIVEQMYERSLNFQSALDDILLKMHDLALWKLAPETVASKDLDPSELQQLGKSLSEEDVQLYYQIALIGKRDLPLAPDPRIGFEMILMRMLAFYPQSQPPAQKPQAAQKPQSRFIKGTGGQTQSASGVHTKPPDTPAKRENPPVAAEPASSIETKPINNADDWHHFLKNHANLSGYADVFAKKLSFKVRDGNKIILELPQSKKLKPDSITIYRPKIEHAVHSMHADNTVVEIEVSSEQNANESYKERTKREQETEIANIAQKIEAEEIPQLLRSEFGATLDKSSIRPIDTEEFSN